MNGKYKGYEILAIHLFLAVYLFVRSADRHGGARLGDFVAPITFILAGIYFSRQEFRKKA